MRAKPREDAESACASPREPLRTRLPQRLGLRPCPGERPRARNDMSAGASPDGAARLRQRARPQRATSGHSTGKARAGANENASPRCVGGARAVFGVERGMAQTKHAREALRNGSARGVAEECEKKHTPTRENIMAVLDPTRAPKAHRG